MKLYKGLSTLVLSFVFVIAILIVFAMMFARFASVYYQATQGIKNVIKYSQLHEISRLTLEEKTGEVNLKNVGSTDIVIDILIVSDQNGRIEARDPLDLCDRKVIPMYSSAKCVPGYQYLVAITPEGTVIDIEKPLARSVVEEIYVKGNTTIIIPVMFSITTPSELSNQFDVPINLVAKPYTKDRASIGFTGIKSDKLLLLPPGQDSELYNTPVATDPKGVSFGVAIIGYDPSWVIERNSDPSIASSPRFQIMIRGPKFSGEKISYGDRQVTLSENGFCIVIRNYTGVIKILDSQGNEIACSSSTPEQCTSGLPAIGFWYYGSTDLGLKLYLNGYADYIANFMRISSDNSATGETSYYPYLYVGDIDGNGVNEIIFVTEDAYYGSSSRINDCIGSCDPSRGGNYIDLSDWSTQPLILKLKSIGIALGSADGSIDGSKIAGLTMYLNIFFHDNSYPDENQLQDIDVTDWVLRILLIDNQGNEYVVREFRYQEICNYHKTRITSFGKDNYFVKISQSVFIPIPTIGRYWVAIAFKDPYKSGLNNDADITVGVEIIGVIPFYR